MICSIVNFLSVNSPIMANLKLPNMISLKMELGRVASSRYHILFHYTDSVAAINIRNIENNTVI